MQRDGQVVLGVEGVEVVVASTRRGRARTASCRYGRSSEERQAWSQREPERAGADGESRANRQPIGILNAERNPSRQAAAEPRRAARLARRPTLTPSALFAPAFVGPGGREG